LCALFLLRRFGLWVWMPVVCGLRCGVGRANALPPGQLPPDQTKLLTETFIVGQCSSVVTPRLDF
jgi:hypothetical protein